MAKVDRPVLPPASLARVLLRKLVVAYGIFALVVTGIKLVVEYRSVRAEVMETLSSLVETFAPGLESALWDYQENLLQSMIVGIGTHPDVVSVEIIDPRSLLSASWHAPSGLLASPDLLVTRSLTHGYGKDQRVLGELRVASSERLLVSRIIRALLAVALVTAAQFVFLGLMLWFLAGRLLVRPLADFSAQVAGLAEEGREQGVVLAESEVAEIETLRKAFNSLMVRLAESRAQIAEQNAGLEVRVAERTRELEAQEVRFRSIFERTNIAAGFADAEGRLLDFNDSLAELLGYEREELLGRDVFSLTHPDDAEREHQLFADVLAGRCQDFRFDKRFITKAGGEVWVDLAVTGIRDEQGQIRHLAGILVDISERKAAEAELRDYQQGLERLVCERTAQLTQAKEAAEAASVAKTAFLANMSHEIRTPLNAINGMAYLIRKAGLPPVQAERLGKLEAASEHLLGIINAILELSKIEAGKLELHHEPVDIHALLESAKVILQERAQIKGLSLVLDIAPQPGNLLGDAVRLRQAVLNYLANAIKFTESGQVTLRVRWSEASAAGARMRLEVEDSGIGVRPEALSRLFSAFEQADNSMTRKYGGTGLGLAINRKLASLMGGETGVSSVFGQGSIFWLTAWLPSAAQQVAPSLPVIPAVAPAAEIGAGKRILVADDEPINREIVLMLLEELAVTVDLAEDGRQALELAQSQTYDLILMDLQMPFMSGIEATLAILALPGRSTVPVVAMTANAFDEDRQACEAAGMSGFLAKPFDPDDFLKQVRRYLQAQEPAGPQA